MARASAADKAEKNPDVCSTEDCGHPRDKHAIPGGTCWGAITCPCTKYARSKQEVQVREHERAEGVVVTPTETR